MHSQHPAETQQFNRDVQFLLKPNNPHARSLLAFIKRTIRQFELQGYVTEIDIFVEAYLRGVRYTQQRQEHIHQPKAWMRHTAYNIIRECKRDRLHYSALAFDELMGQGAADTTSPPAVDDAAITNAINSVIEAFEALSVGDRNLIQWKVIEGLSWQDVQTRLVAEGEDRSSQATLRKRGQRALERLRRAYHVFSYSELVPPEMEVALTDNPDDFISSESHPRNSPGIALGRAERVSQVDSDTVSTPKSNSRDESNVFWTITLEGDLSGTPADEQLIESIVAELKQRSGDNSLALIRFRRGSIVIELDGSDEGYKIIEALISSGQLTNILGLQVKKIALVSEFSHKDQKVESLQRGELLNHRSQNLLEIPLKRSDIYKFLTNLPSPQFSEVVFHLNPPRGILPRSDASLGDRVAALLDWVESPVGPGLEELRASMVTVLNCL